jgi:acetyl-CoA carboxylase biotin carboxylase subunit
MLVRRSAIQARGPFEFLLDEDGSFYFMEMNTRIQVEHPVTEMVTLADIVRNQIRIASGEIFSISRAMFRSLDIPSSAGSTPKIPVKFTPSPGKITAFNIRAVREFESIQRLIPITRCRRITIR